MARTERCPTGIEGFDGLLLGGFPRGRTILLSGGCGTGKTAFGVEFIYNGAIKYNEAGIFVALEQNPLLLRSDMSGLGYDMEKVEREGKVRIIDGSLSKRGPDAIIKARALYADLPVVTLPENYKISDINNRIMEVAKDINAKRVVIDSISSISEILSRGTEIRGTILELNYSLQDAELTSVIISDTINDELTIPEQAMEEYVADGVVILKANDALNTRTLRIKKMRGTKHTLKPMVFDLTTAGLKVG